MVATFDEVFQGGDSGSPGESSSKTLPSLERPDQQNYHLGLPPQANLDGLKLKHELSRIQQESAPIWITLFGLDTHTTSATLIDDIDDC